MDPTLQEPVHEAFRQGLDSLPLSTHSLVLGGLVAGVLMWLLGRHILRLAFILVGMAFGGIASSLLLPSVASGIPPVLAIIIGAAIGGVLSFAAFRLAVAIWLGVLGSALGVSICALIIGFTMPPPSVGPLQGDDLLLDGVPLVEPESSETVDPAPIIPLNEQDARHATNQRIRAFVGQLSDEARSSWDSIPSDQRLKLISSALVGLSLGAIVGFLAPKRSSAALTACVGAAVVIASGLWLASAGGLTPPRLPLAAWALVWIVLSAVGMRVQFMGSRRRADND